MMNPKPVIIDEDEFIQEAEYLMINKKITTVLVGSSQKHTVKGIYQIYNR
jgi:arabinose-5-phosphate isomerase